MQLLGALLRLDPAKRPGWAFLGVFPFFFSRAPCSIYFFSMRGVHAATSCLQSPLVSPPAAALSPKATAEVIAIAALSLLELL